jgi:hypothetical protein
MDLKLKSSPKSVKMIFDVRGFKYEAFSDQIKNLPNSRIGKTTFIIYFNFDKILISYLKKAK